MGVRQDGRVLDEALVERFCDGDQELLGTLVDLYRRTLPEQLDAIRAAASERDDAALARAGHKLKGSVSNVAAERVGHWATTLERAGRERVFQGVDDAVAALDREISALLDALAALSDR